MSLAVVPTGTANMSSILAAFRRLGADPKPAASPSDVAGADHVVLPGVGAFGSAMDEVDRRGLRDALADRVEQGRPTLAVCVGMQLLAADSEESDGAVGLGVVHQRVGRFGAGAQVPQMGWNEVEPGPECRLVTAGWAYFANSYRLDSVPEGWAAATSSHGGRFVSALERGSVLACQFHPELSGAWGSRLLGRWLDDGRAR